MLGKKELQADYFQRKEVSLHVSIIHRHATLEKDGISSTEEDPVIIAEQFFTISEDLQHDQYITREVQRQIAKYLRSISYTTTVMHEFTDGCAQQYKSRHCLGDLSVCARELGYETVVRNYFETAHAKGPQDAAGGYVKAQADLAVTRGQVLIQNAHDLYQFASAKLTSVFKDKGCKRRVFVHVDTIPRDETSLYNPVQDVRSIHQAIAGGDGRLQIRRLSCYFCDNCIDVKYNLCQNTKMTGQYRSVQVMLFVFFKKIPITT